MNTAEVAIEHVLAGILALCAFALPFFSRQQVSGKFSQTWFIVAVVGAAYVFGVVFDRLADTILSPLEHYTRLKLVTIPKKPLPSYRGDPFPQDLLEFSLRRADDGRLAWMDSLRSRIRTCRGLSVLGAPAAMGIAIFWQWNNEDARLARLHGSLIAVNLFLVVIPVLAQVLFSLKPFEGFRLPRTDELACRNKSISLLTHALALSSCYFAMLIYSLTVTVVTLFASNSTRLAVWLCGVAVFALAFLAWSQITETYMKFVAREMPDLLQEGRTRLPRRVSK